MSFRTIASVVTLILLAVIVFLARHEIVRAWQLLGSVNLWVLALIIPAQIVVYFIAGEMMFCYLRDKKAIHGVSLAEQARMALEMNFVNHALPSAGVSGISYMTWRLSRYDISPGRATLAQLVRFVASYMAFIVLLMIALIAITIDGSINRWMILLSSMLVGLMLGTTAVAVFLLTSKARSRRFADWLGRLSGRVGRIFGRARPLIDQAKIKKFFFEMHDDFVALMQDKRMFLKPFLWGLAFTIGDVMLYVITFWALGVPVNPAPILIAYGLATTSAVFVVTPGGTGAFEAIMVSCLAVAGVPGNAAIAGTLLTRVILLLGTISLGYFFYQHALIKYGKPKSAA